MKSSTCFGDIVILKETTYKGISKQDFKIYIYNAKIKAGM
jgi:hypothetical protein